jgi:hypothetical protein
MNAKLQAMKEQAIAGAMSELIRNQHFGEFIDVLRAQRDAVQLDLCSEKVLESERLTLATIGELRCFNAIISYYEDLLARAAETEE